MRKHRIPRIKVKAKWVGKGLRIIFPKPPIRLRRIFIHFHGDPRCNGHNFACPQDTVNLVCIRLPGLGFFLCVDMA